jgi:hypothetical protein
MQRDRVPLIELLYQALHAERGIKVQVISPSVEAFRQKLYAARRESADPDLDALSFWISPINPAVLWIGKSNGTDSRE